MSPSRKAKLFDPIPSRGFQDIFKRRLLTLCSGLVKCRSFELMFQDLATVDVLRGMKYPLVPFGTPFAYTCVRIRVTLTMWHENILYSAWASRCRFKH